MRAVPLVAAVLLAVAGWTTSAGAQAPEQGPPRAPPPPYTYVPPPDPSAQTLLVPPPAVHHGGYGAPEVKVTSLAGTSALLAGMQGGWIIGHSFVLGGAGYGLVTSVPSPEVIQPASGDLARLSMGYGGGRVGGTFQAYRVAHLGLGALVGGGSVSSQTANGSARRSDSFFVIEPDVFVEVNLAKHVRFSTSFSYRFAGGTEAFGLTPANLSGPSWGLALKLGSF